MEIVRCVRGDSKPIACKLLFGLPRRRAHDSIRARQEVYMKTLYPFSRYRDLALTLVAVATLTACASGPGGRTQASRQPLQRLDLPQPAPATDALTSTLAAEFALSNADLETAVREYTRAAQASDDPSVAAQATHVAIAAKQWEPARTALARWQTLNPADTEIWQARALLELHDGKVEAAYEDLLRLAKEPDGKGWRSIAQALMRADKTQAGTLLERLATPELLGAKEEIWVAISQLAQRLERKPQARSLADRAVAKFASADAYIWAAQLKLEAGDRIGARVQFADALHHDAKNSHLRIAYATLLGELGDNAEAAHILAQGPQDDYIYAVRAAYAARANDKTLIEPLYKELKALPEPRPGARLNLLGELAELLERKTEALAWYSQVPESDEHRFEVQLRRAVLLDDAGKPTDAMSLIHQLQARVGDDAKQLGDVFLLEAELSGKHQHD